jgi:hypothetical protein
MMENSNGRYITWPEFYAAMQGLEQRIDGRFDVLDAKLDALKTVRDQNLGAARLKASIIGGITGLLGALGAFFGLSVGGS